MIEPQAVAKKSKKSEKKSAPHPDHAGELPRLRRVRGQLEGIERMVNDRRYCMDILQQVRAAKSALQAFESAILKSHLKMCVHSAFTLKDRLDADKKIEEIIDIIER